MSNQKIRIIVLSCILLLGIAFTIYRYFGLNDEFDITDADALNAVKWLQTADKNDFDQCRKSAAENAGKWFDLFVKNRKSLGKLIYRRLKTKKADKGGVYKITFSSAFKNTRKIDENVWISKDGKVWQAKYSYMRMPFPDWRSKDNGTPAENAEVKNAMLRAISAMKKLDVEYFDQVMLRSEKFRFGKRLVKRFKQQFERSGLPYKDVIGNRIRYTRTFPGMTQINGAIATATCLYKIKGKTYRQAIIAALYKDNSASRPQWEIYRFGARRLREQKARKPAKKKTVPKEVKNAAK